MRENAFKILISICLLVIILVAYFARLDMYPSYLHFDMSREGMFINNIARHHDYQYRLGDPAPNQIRFVHGLAAARLSYSFFMAQFVRLLSINPANMDVFLKISAGIFILFGLFGAGFVFYAKAVEDFISFLALAAIFPPILLIGRNGSAFLALLFAVGWLSIYLLHKYCQEAKPKYLYIGAIFIAFIGINVHPSCFPLPLIILLLLILNNSFKRTILNPHTYIAIIICIVLAAGSYVALGEHFAQGAPSLWEQQQVYTKPRQNTFLAVRQQSAGILPRAGKYLDQHFLFKKDNLGDRSFDDNLFLLGKTPALYWIFYALLPFGLVVGLKQKDQGTTLSLSIWLVTVGLFSVWGFPEGRYILLACPCYAYHVMYALKFIFKNTTIRSAAATILSLGLVINTLAVAKSDYQPVMHKKWRACEGIKEIALKLASVPNNGVQTYITLPERLDRFSWSYFSLLTDSRFLWITASDMQHLTEIKDGSSLALYVSDGKELAATELFKQLSFQEFDSLSLPNSRIVKIYRVSAIEAQRLSH